MVAVTLTRAALTSWRPSRWSRSDIRQLKPRLSCCCRGGVDPVQFHPRTLGLQSSRSKLLQLLFRGQQLFFEVLDLSVRSDDILRTHIYAMIPGTQKRVTYLIDDMRLLVSFVN